jgi:diacylglycerol kinase family enzyme
MMRTTRRLLPTGLATVTRRLATTGLPDAGRLARTVAWQTTRAIDRGRVRPLDVGRVNGHTFLLMAGVGFDAEVVALLDRRRARSPGPIGLSSYVWPTIDAAADGRFPPLTVHVDGRRVFGPTPGLVIVANLPQYGLGVPLVPNALGDDGRLDVVCLRCDSHVSLLRLTAAVLGGRHLDLPGTVTVRGQQVEIDSPQTMAVQADGDAAGTLPARVELHPTQVPFLDLAAT